MAARIEPGTEIAGYRIQSLLHAGGNGYVYSVSAPAGADPGFPLIIKVPGIGPGEAPLGLVSFEVEQMIHPALTGPHVPRLVASGVSGMLPYIVMEKVAKVVEAYAICEVEEACKPFWNQRMLVVAFTAVPKLVVGDACTA